MKSYRFGVKEKDPVIEIARRCIEIYAALHGLKFIAACHRIARDSGVTYHCLNNWFYGGTRTPYFDTVVRVVHATGREVSIGEHGMGSEKRFRVIKGGKAA